MKYNSYSLGTTLPILPVMQLDPTILSWQTLDMEDLPIFCFYLFLFDAQERDSVCLNGFFRIVELILEFKFR